MPPCQADTEQTAIRVWAGLMFASVLLLAPAMVFAAPVCNVQWDKLKFEKITVTRQVVDNWDNGTISLTTYIYSPLTPGKHPLAIYNHGSTGGNSAIVKQPNYPSCGLIQFFIDNNYVVASINRRGRGESTGTYVEECYSGDSTCTSPERDMTVGYPEAVKDVEAVIPVLLARSDVDSNKVIMMGQSRGGYLAITYAGTHPSIKAVVNFSGGWFGDAGYSYSDLSPAWQQAIQYVRNGYRQAGSQTKVPTIWLYGDKDSFYSQTQIQYYFQDFKDGGGNGSLTVFPNTWNDNGHYLYLYYSVWTPTLTTFIQSLLFPPSGITVQTSPNSVRLQFSPVAGATGYRVYYGSSSGNYTGVIDLGNSTDKTINAPAGTYFGALTAYNSTSESGYSAEGQVVVPGTSAVAGE